MAKTNIAIDKIISKKGSNSKSITIKISDETKNKLDRINNFLDSRELKIAIPELMKDYLEEILESIEEQLKEKYKEEYNI